MPEIYVKVHYCIICKKTEICQNEECDFREVLHAHGYCYATLSDTEKAKLDQDIEKGLGADIKEAEKKAKRELYEKEYRKQWKEKNPHYHNSYRQNHKDVIKRITKRYSTSEKGKAVRKKYADSTKKKRAEYQKNYIKEYRKKKKNFLTQPQLTQLTQRQKQINSPLTNIFSTKRISNLNPNFSNPIQSSLVTRYTNREARAKLLESKIKEMEEILEKADLTTQGTVNIQKLLMRSKTELKRMRNT